MLPRFDFSPKFGIRTKQFWKTIINEFLVSCGFYITNAGLGSTPVTWGISYLLWTTLSTSADIIAPVTFLKAAFSDGKSNESKFFHAVCVMISQIFAVMVCFQTGGYPVGPLTGVRESVRIIKMQKFNFRDSKPRLKFNHSIFKNVFQTLPFYFTESRTVPLKPDR